MLANRAAPLHLLAFAFGAASTIYISFAGDRIERAGGLAGLGEGGSSALIFVSFGVAGLAGLLTGRVGKRTGLTPLLRMLFSACAASFALIALAPGSLAGVVASAALQGAFVMMISAALAFWSERLFPELPSMSFTAALLASAAGAVTGPVLAGFAVDAFGFAAMFLALAGASGLTVALVPPRLLPALQISAGGA
ncbi:MAG: MFS transporter, partial [Oceanicaulis sp.]